MNQSFNRDEAHRLMNLHKDFQSIVPKSFHYKQNKQQIKLKGKQVKVPKSTSLSNLNSDSKKKADSPPLFAAPKSKEEWLKRSSFIRDSDRQYFQIFQDFIKNNKLWSQKEISENENQGQPFSLLEDVALLYFVSMDPEHANSQYFANMTAAGLFPGRSTDSLRERFKRFLKYITHDDIIKIGGVLLQHGPNGTLHFRKVPGSSAKVLHYVEKVGLESQKGDNKIKINDDPNPKKKLQESAKRTLGDFSADQPKVKKIKCVCNMSNFKCVVQASQLKPHYEELDDIDKSKHRVQQLANQAETSLKPMDSYQLKVTFDFETKHRSAEKDHSQSLKVYNDRLKWFHKEFKVEKTKLVKELDNVSGDFADLLQVVKKQDQKQDNKLAQLIKWTQEEDRVLANTEDPKDPVFTMLVRNKGEERVKRRIRYKNMKLAFPFK